MVNNKESIKKKFIHGFTRSFFKKMDGFTVIELVVAMAIFGLLSAATIANFRQAQKSDALRHDSLALSENIRKVQNLGMSGQVFEGDVPPGGYGVLLNPTYPYPSTEYFLFADTEVEDTFHYYEEGLDEKLPNGVFTLSENVVIQKFVVTQVTMCETCRASVSFQPPKPYPHACANLDTVPSCGSTRNVCILMKQEQIDQCRLIFINGVSGQVSEESNQACEIPEELCPPPGT